ncbi:Glutathione-independent formaldehyde dehydrogenase [Pseudobythopirellula maris]|uniref:Glutathione-independent formaldehyde dehydrogenase n=1 Tax=Pseudobythopirellula maris TaxID=2527991 RepID=A0A5C5ZTH3_9BACT|nr:zinc-dependent alcohol dehydrogenase [Pseudobythopirellula maris]TWT90375.1 Glutathione-independent formaldehyde dehydrogenase [Pseudobythopirellula maris]
MKAVVFHGVGDIRLDDIPEPKIQDPNDAIVQITTSAICGTDLHFVRGTAPGMKPGTVLGHEAVGVVVETGRSVRNLRAGDRVVIPSTIGCGSCSYCRDGYFAQCDTANPNGSLAGTSFYGGPEPTGPFDGLQAEYARIPFANVGLVKLPDEVSDEQAIPLSDIFPTGHFGAKLAEVGPGDTVAVFGCGPVGQFAIVSAFLLGAGRVLAIDNLPSRLEIATAQGAETIDFDEEDPVETLRDLTGGIGPDRVIDAVGVDAERRGDSEPSEGEGELWEPGGAPSQALDWAVQSVAKAGTVSIIGVYPPEHDRFPIGAAMNKNLTVNMGNCNHRRYMPELLRLVQTGAVDPMRLVTQQEKLVSAIEAYEAFDRREEGWLKVELVTPAVQMS